MLQLSARVAISLDRNGVMHFDSDAIKEFRGRDIEFVAFSDWRTGRTAMRLLAGPERDALGIIKPDFCAEVRSDDGETPRDYLRAVGIKVRRGKKYHALLNRQGNGIIVTVW
jgi:hypothetical protein